MINTPTKINTYWECFHLSKQQSIDVIVRRILKTNDIVRLLRYICQLQRKASYLCWTSFFRKLIQCILYVGFKTSITGAYICWKPFIYRHSPYQFPYIWYMHVAIFTPHTTQPEWMAQYSLLCLSACIYISLFYMHYLFVCL